MKTLLLLLLFIPLISATAPSVPESLYVSEIIQSNPTFTFLDYKNEPTSYLDEEYGSQPDLFSYKTFITTGTSIVITVNDQEVLRENLSYLAQESNSSRYTLPVIDELEQHTLESQLQKFEGARLIIYIDEIAVREYILGYRPAMVKGHSPYININLLVFFGLPVIFIAVLILIIVGTIRKKKNKNV